MTKIKYKYFAINDFFLKCKYMYINKNILNNISESTAQQNNSYIRTILLKHRNP